MTSSIFLVHALPGRTRLRVRSDRDQLPGLLNQIASTLSACSQVLSVETNALTGSVLVHHKNQAATADLVLFLAQDIVAERPLPTVSSIYHDGIIPAAFAPDILEVTQVGGRITAGTLVSALYTACPYFVAAVLSSVKLPLWVDVVMQFLLLKISQSNSAWSLLLALLVILPAFF